MIREQDFGCQRAKNKEAKLHANFHLVSAVLLPQLARCDFLQSWPLCAVRRRAKPAATLTATAADGDWDEGARDQYAASRHVKKHGAEPAQAAHRPARPRQAVR